MSDVDALARAAAENPDLAPSAGTAVQQMLLAQQPASVKWLWIATAAGIVYYGYRYSRRRA